jgi:hypothetical protein
MLKNNGRPVGARPSPTVDARRTTRYVPQPIDISQQQQRQRTTEEKQPLTNQPTDRPDDVFTTRGELT